MLPHVVWRSGILRLIFVLAVVWEMVWKAIALWRAGRNNQLGWYVALFLLNTLGILPIIYLSFFQREEQPPAVG